MQDHQQEMEGLKKANTVLSYTNMVVTDQLVQLMAAMVEVQEQILKLSTNTKSKRKYYF